MTWDIGYVRDMNGMGIDEWEDRIIDGHAAQDGVTACGQSLLTSAWVSVRVSCQACRRVLEDRRELVEVLIDSSGVVHQGNTVLTLQKPLELYPPKTFQNHWVWCLGNGGNIASSSWTTAPVGTPVSCLACLSAPRKPT